MPDITMCNDYSCPDFDRCYRAQAKPSVMQSYFVGSPRKMDGCDRLWPIFKEQVKELLEKERENSPRHRGELNENE